MSCPVCNGAPHCPCCSEEPDYIECPDCEGSGFVMDEDCLIVIKCERCDGYGSIENEDYGTDEDS